MAKETTTNKALSLKSLTKSTVWDVQENDIFRMLEMGEKDAELKDNLRHFADIIRSAFMIEEISDDKLIHEKYAKLGYKVGSVKLGEDNKVIWAVKKRPITRVTDLTYENIRHITAAKLIEVLDRNFGGGWESLSQSIQDIIESGFDISTTQLPASRIHAPGGTLEKKVAQGYDVLEIVKGTWIEAIFAKKKDPVEKLRFESSFYKSEEDENLNDEDVEDMDDRETCMVFRGADTHAAQEEALRDAIEERWPLLEVEFVDGGMCVYHWMLGLA